MPCWHVNTWKLRHPSFELCRSSSPCYTTHVSQPILNQRPKTHYKLQSENFHLTHPRPVPWQQLLHVVSVDNIAATGYTHRANTGRERSGPAKQAPRGWGLPTPRHPSAPTIGRDRVPTAQEALLHTFLGERLASTAATLAQQWGALTSHVPTTSSTMPPRRTQAQPSKTLPVPVARPTAVPATQLPMTPVPPDAGSHARNKRHQQNPTLARPQLTDSNSTIFWLPWTAWICKRL